MAPSKRDDVTRRGVSLDPIRLENHTQVLGFDGSFIVFAREHEGSNQEPPRILLERSVIAQTARDDGGFSHSPIIGGRREPVRKDMSRRLREATTEVGPFSLDPMRQVRSSDRLAPREKWTGIEGDHVIEVAAPPRVEQRVAIACDGRGQPNGIITVLAKRIASELGSQLPNEVADSITRLPFGGIFGREERGDQNA